VIKQATKKDLVWGYIAQGLNVGAGIILLPLVLRFFGPADVGLWFVFLTMAGLAQLLEFGFQPTLVRNVAYVFSGAKSLSKEGFAENASGAEVDEELLSGVYYASKRISRFVAIIAAVVLFVGGTFYILSLLEPSQDAFHSILAWVFFAFGYVINFYFGYLNAFLQGRGDITHSNMVIVVNRSIMLGLGAIAICFGGGLVGLGVASLFSALISRLLAVWLFNRGLTVKISSKYFSLDVQSQITGALWHNASRLGLVQVGSFLIQRSSILIAASVLGLDMSAAYSMTISILLTLSAVSGVVCQVNMPQMSALQSSGATGKIRPIYGETLILSWLVYVTGFACVVFFLDPLLNVIGSEVTLLPPPELLLLGLVFLLEVNHSIAASYLTTQNKVAFLWPSLLAGAAIVVLSLVMLTYFAPLPWVLVFSQGFVQLMYNNWKWPVEAVKHLGGNFIDLLQSGGKKLVRR